MKTNSGIDIESNVRCMEATVRYVLQKMTPSGTSIRVKGVIFSLDMNKEMCAQIDVELINSFAAPIHFGVEKSHRYIEYKRLIPDVVDMVREAYRATFALIPINE